MSVVTRSDLLTKQSSFSLANGLAANRCRAAMAALLHRDANTTVMTIQSKRGDARLARAAEPLRVKYEVGFGSIATDHHEPTLRLSALQELFSGQSLKSVPLLLPVAPLNSPLTAALSQAFPVLIRGTIAKSSLVMNSDELRTESFSRPLSPYREARATLWALDVEEIRLHTPSIDHESEYYEAVVHQMNQRFSDLRKFFIGDPSHE